MGKTRASEVPAESGAEGVAGDGGGEGLRAGKGLGGGARRVQRRAVRPHVVRAVEEGLTVFEGDAGEGRSAGGKGWRWRGVAER